MVHSLKNVLGRPWLVGSYFLFIGLFVAFYQSDVADYLNIHLEQKVSYAFRDWVDQTPKMDPRLKVYSMEDKTVAALRQPDMKLKGWAFILEQIAKRQPKAIFIDKIFRLPIGDTYGKALTDERAKWFINYIHGLNVPIYTGSTFTQAKNIKTKWADVHLDSEIYSPKKALVDPAKGVPQWIPQESGKVLGPHGRIRDAFILGHFKNAGYGYIYPFLRFENKLIPHIALMATSKVQGGEKHVAIDDYQVLVDSRGRLQPDLLTVSRFEELDRKLVEVPYYTAKKKPLTYVNKGDVVAILPLMYTGNTDFKETPLGKIPGGLILTAAANSALANLWFRPLGGEMLFVSVLCLLGMIAGSRLGPRLFWSANILVGLSGMVAGIGLFTYYHTTIPWMTYIGAFAWPGTFRFIERAFRQERRAHALRTALAGTIPSDRIDEVLKNPEAMVRRPSEEELTILFIDIVGFSLVSETQSPEVAFSELKLHIQAITETLHKHGGVIDKTMGDGVMAFFGMDFATGKPTVGHATQAVRCAIDIQRECLTRNQEAHERGQFMYPLRIGINTARVFIGDVGDSNRIDYTLIGHGVNFAARLEPACEPFQIMIGESTNEGAQISNDAGVAIYERRIQIKHYDELFVAYEVSPFNDNFEEFQSLWKAYRLSRQMNRSDPRYAVQRPGMLKLVTKIDRSDLVEMSSTGFSMKLPMYLAKGVVLNASIESDNPLINEQLRMSGLMPFMAEVKWGLPTGDSFLQGMQIKSLNKDQKEMLFEICRGSLDLNEALSA